jgi:quercetin dioxygenase-like cupin family protein
MANNKRKKAELSQLNPVEKPEGIFRTTLAYNDETMLCHFHMKKGAAIPLHNHGPAQIGYVISGKVKFLNEDGSTNFVAEKGTSYVFDPDETHGAEVLEDAEVLECFAPSRPEYADN